MSDKCKTEYKAMLSRIDQVINAQWPETLRDDGGVWLWLDDQRVEMRRKLTDLQKRLNAAWCNGMFEEMKQLTLEWGRLTLEIFKEYAQHLKRSEA